MLMPKTKPSADKGKRSHQERLSDIAADTKKAAEFVTLHCGHDTSCKECLNGMFDVALKDKKTAALRCPNPDCKQEINQADAEKLTNDRKKLEQLSDIQLQEWLIQQQTTKQCPTPNCSYSFINERTDQFTHHCPQCKKEYCGKCLIPHTPSSTCKQAEDG